MSKPAANRRSTRGEYIETDTGNKVSRKCKIEGTPHIILAGRVVVMADACLRGDLVRLPDASTQAAAEAKEAGEGKAQSRTAISVGRYTVINQGATLHPPHRLLRGELSYYPQRLGEHVFVGPRAFVSAASIGSFVYIGAEAIVGNGCIIKDSVKILEGAVLPAGMVVPSGVVVGGMPARVLGEVGDGWGVLGPGANGEATWVEGGELRELVRSIK